MTLYSGISPLQRIGMSDMTAKYESQAVIGQSSSMAPGC